MDIVKGAGASARKELIVGRSLGFGRLDAFFEGPPEARGLEGAMFGKSCLHRVIRGA